MASKCTMFNTLQFQELREKNWKAMEALEKAEKSSAEKVDKAMKSARVNIPSTYPHGVVHAFSSMNIQAESKQCSFYPSVLQH